METAFSNVYIYMYIDIFFFFKQKTAYEIGTGDWSSDVCSSDLNYSVGACGSFRSLPFHSFELKLTFHRE